VYPSRKLHRVDNAGQWKTYVAIYMKDWN